MPRNKTTPSTLSSVRREGAKLTKRIAAETDPLIRHGLEATLYALQIVSGEIVACVSVRQACQRHLDDLEKSKSESYPWRFDLTEAGRICGWLALMPNVDAPGCPDLEIQPAQKFWFGSIFGWVRKSDDVRRFLRAYISIPRKNTKTTSLAGVGLFMLAADGEQGAQVYNGANKLEQAMYLFNPAKAMVEARPELFARLGVQKRGEKCLYVPSTNSRWRPVSKKPGDGGGASCFLQDEYHEAKSDELSDTIVPGQIARKQPLDLKITTAGFNIGGPCDRYEQQMKKLLEGSISRERTFAIIYSGDWKPYVDPFGIEQPADDWTDVRVGQKANPFWGVSVDPEKYAASLEEALQDPYKAALHKTKHLNIWCNAAQGFYDMQKWAACADPTLKIEDFLGQDCLEGLDLASKLDLCASVTVFRRTIHGPDPATGRRSALDHYFIFCSAYLPSSVANRPESSDYRAWADGGWLTITEGDITDYRFILRDLLNKADRFNILEVDFDQRESGFLLQQFGDASGQVPLFEIPQKLETLNEPMKWLQSLVVNRQLHHDGNPLLSWAISNVVVKVDHNENVFPRKAGDDLKIDPHSALLNAMVRVRDLLSQPAPQQQDEVEVW